MSSLIDWLINDSPWFSSIPTGPQELATQQFDPLPENQEHVWPSHVSAHTIVQDNIDINTGIGSTTL